MSRKFKFLVLGCVRIFVGAAGLAACLLGGQAMSATVGPGGLSGVWLNVDQHFGVRAVSTAPKAAGGGPVPMTSWAADIVKKRLRDAAAGHPFEDARARCLQSGSPDMLFDPGPMQILEEPNQVTLLRQNLMYYRIIHLNQPHQTDPDPSFNGDSVARWDGNTLVVDTIGVKDETTIQGIIPHSDQLHLVERFRPTGANTMDIQVTIEDPKAFTKPWVMAGHFRRGHAGLIEAVCAKNLKAFDLNFEKSKQLYAK